MQFETLAVLAFVTFQRIGELVLSNRNTKALVARGAYEVDAGHYPFMVALHAAWLGGLWFLAHDLVASGPLIFLYALVQGARIWVMASLGERWTTRIIVLPEAPL